MTLTKNIGTTHLTSSSFFAKLEVVRQLRQLQLAKGSLFP